MEKEIKDSLIEASSSNSYDEKLKSKYKSSTHQKMQEQLSRIDRNVFGGGTTIIDNYVQKYEQVIEYFEKVKPTVAKVLCNTVRQVIECYGLSDTPAGKAYYQYYGRITNSLKEHPFSEVKEGEFPLFQWNDVGNVWAQLHRNFKDKPKIKQSDYQIYLIFSLYYLLPPLRPQDWINSKIVRLPPNTDLIDYTIKNGNIIDMTSHQLVVSDYKTAIKHGTRIIPFNELSDEFGKILSDIVEKYLANNQNIEYLLTTRSGQPIAEQNTAKIFNKLDIKGQITNAAQLRNLFISEKIMDANLSLERRERLAYIMGHTIQTQTFIYSKYSQCLHGKTKSEEESSSGGGTKLPQNISNNLPSSNQK